MTLKVIPGSGQRAEDVTGELADLIKELIYGYSGRLTLAAAIGVLAIVQIELMKDHEDAP
jgi:hypothetical protein